MRKLKKAAANPRGRKSAARCDWIASAFIDAQPDTGHSIDLSGSVLARRSKLIRRYGTSMTPSNVTVRELDE